MADTRDRILTATIELLRRRGYRATSLKDITSASAATVGSVYHFFPGGKAELVEVAIGDMGRAYRELFELITSTTAEPIDAFGDFFAAAADALEQIDFIDICPIGTIAGEVASTEGQLRRATSDVFASWTGAVAARLIDAGTGPEAAEELATTIIATLEGSFILARAQRDAEPVRTAGRHVRTLIEAHGRVSRGSVPRSTRESVSDRRQNR